MISPETNGLQQILSTLGSNIQPSTFATNVIFPQVATLLATGLEVSQTVTASFRKGYGYGDIDISYNSPNQSVGCQSLSLHESRVYNIEHLYSFSDTPGTNLGKKLP